MQLPPKTKKKPPARLPDPDAHESRGAVAVTVVWMLLVLSCLAAQAVAFVVWVIAHMAGIPPHKPNALYLVSTTLMLVALVSGIMVLAFTPLVYRVRKSSPPTMITVVAIVIAVGPLVAIGIAMAVG